MAFQRTAIVLSIDGLGARSLGPYGNSWFETANFNRLAAQSTLSENAFATNPGDQIRFWNFLDSLPESIEQSVQLVSDDSDLCNFAAERVSEVDHVVQEMVESPAVDWTQTGPARFFSFAAEAISQIAPGQLLVLHTRSMLDCWDSPVAFREHLAEDEDPPPPLTTTCPNLLLERDYDPDSLLGWQQVYGAQVHVLDLCLGILLDQLDDFPIDRQPLLVVTSPRGFPLGEHRTIGYDSPNLYDELIQVPFLVRAPSTIHPPARQLELTTPAKAFEMAGAFVIDQVDAIEALANPLLPNRKRQFLCSATQGFRSIRTHAWKMIVAGIHHELYVMPDDRWEQNNVTDRCPDVIEKLNRLLDEDQSRARTEDLADILAFGHA